ncbi:U1 zinc finger [Brugia malayi]|uniref:U1 small nuclear ribonucleoprotein C n=3 Tax=Brugia TaxID=6278 RepID=A0A0K0J961_BRUMA|nr:U1 zinc finger [Brugia malayi]CDP98438.1 Bm3183 [Brugia malayi]VIO98983.1 U1 zinc finger [Brugia malayi]
MGCINNCEKRACYSRDMPKYYCDYCDTFLTHDSPSVRKTHNGGRKHKENVRMFYQKWMEEQAQKLVDATARAFTQGRMGSSQGTAPRMPMAVSGPRPPIMTPVGGPPVRGPMPFPYPPMGAPMGPPMMMRPPFMMPTGPRREIR